MVSPRKVNCRDWDEPIPPRGMLPDTNARSPQKDGACSFRDLARRHRRVNLRSAFDGQVRAAQDRSPVVLGRGSLDPSHPLKSWSPLLLSLFVSFLFSLIVLVFVMNTVMISTTTHKQQQEQMQELA